MSDGSATSQQRGEKEAYLSTWVRPEVKQKTRQRAEQEGVTVAEYLRRLVRDDSRTAPQIS